jgi:hypothetical protein
VAACEGIATHFSSSLRWVRAHATAAALSERIALFAGPDFPPKVAPAFVRNDRTSLSVDGTVIFSPVQSIVKYFDDIDATE